MREKLKKYFEMLKYYYSMRSAETNCMYCGKNTLGTRCWQCNDFLSYEIKNTRERRLFVEESKNFEEFEKKVMLEKLS